MNFIKKHYEKIILAVFLLIFILSLIWTIIVLNKSLDVTTEDLKMENDPEFIKRFEQFYTVRMSNYPVQDVYLPRGRRIETEVFT